MDGGATVWGVGVAAPATVLHKVDVGRDAGGTVAGWEQDDFETGGSVINAGAITYDTSACKYPPPVDVCRQVRYGNFYETITGLTPGQIYTCYVMSAWYSTNYSFTIKANGVLKGSITYTDPGASPYPVLQSSFDAVATADGRIVLRFDVVTTFAMVNAIAVDTYGESIPWSPAFLTQAMARYKATEITGLADSDPVATWEDRILGLFDANMSDAGSQPLYRTGGGTPYVQFDGTSDYMNTGIVTAFGDFAVFIVFRMFNMTEAASRVIDKQYDVGFWIGAEGTGAGSLGGGIIQPSSPFGDFYTASANTWYAMLFMRNGTTKTIRFAGSSNTATVSGSALSTHGVTLGYGGAGTAQMDVKEVVVCNDDISGTDLTNLIAYALSEYGLTL